MTDVLTEILANLTDAQREAVTHIDGPLLVLAGAGSGKTRVITRRVAHLMANGVDGANILAVTFTNKAANEMKERIEAMMPSIDPDGWAGMPTVATFHSFSARVLRLHCERVGLPRDYSIYDESDRTRAVKLAIEQAGLSPDNFNPGDLGGFISGQKNKLIDAAQYAKQAHGWADKQKVEIYKAYEQVLLDADALDFDDLLLRLARLLERDKDFRETMAERYRYVLIDEYQDTNQAQYQIARDLSAGHKNICATGDPDQSIYGWRGADMNNILRFEKDYPGAKVVRLEQNYRSTKRILAAADALIQRNVQRKHKRLWTENPQGDPIDVVRVTDAEAEAAAVADRIEKAQQRGLGYSEMAIFMRLNALTRVIEDVLRRRKIPYQIARGTSFYQRKEIKDAVAYLRLLSNRADRVSLERIINTPTRGIGNTTVGRLVDWADANNTSLWDACARAGEIDTLGRGQAAVKKFVTLIENLAAAAEDASSVAEVVQQVLKESGLSKMYEDDENASANLGELITAAGEYDRETDFQATLAEWLNDVALVSDVDAIDESQGAVMLMTLHAAKGLEFPLVFIVGVEKGMIPHERDGQVRDEEEERRLFFVGITRAMKKVVLVHTAERTMYGRTNPSLPSPFLREMPGDVLNEQDEAADYQPTFQPGWANRFGRRGGAGASGQSGGGWKKRTGSLQPGIGSATPKSYQVDEEIGATSSSADWPVGALVRHKKFGLGRIVKVAPSGGYTKATIDFKNSGLKAVMLEMAPVEKVEG